MNWFNHLVLTGSSLAGLFKEKRCLLVTRCGINQANLAALETELGCSFTVIRPSPLAMEIKGPYRNLQGHCWSVLIPGFRWCFEQDQGYTSPLCLKEDGLGLGPSNSSFNGIVEQGRGRFLHQNKRLFFSTPDNSAPNINGHSYVVEAAPEPFGEHVLDMEHCGQNRLGLSKPVLEKIRRLRPELILLAEPPARNTIGIVGSLSHCGPCSLVFYSGKRWEVLDLRKAALPRPRLGAGLAQRSVRNRASGLRARLTSSHGRISGLLPKKTLRPLFRLQADPRLILTTALRQKTTPPQTAPGPADPFWSMFARDLDKEQTATSKRKGKVPDRFNIVQYIGQLSPGGAERQICYLAGGLKQSGHKVAVMTGSPLEGSSRHYAPLLKDLGVDCFQAGTSRDNGLLKTALEHPGLKKNLLPFIPPALAPLIRNLMTDLIRIRPQIIHCWLDWNNIVGGLAGYLTGVPLIVLSTRNLNPSRFPTFYRPWQSRWYPFLVRSKRVCLVANSRAGARDYASWLGLSPKIFRVIRNGLDPQAITKPEPGEVADLKKELGLSGDDLLVGGVFRLDPEKRPLDFLKVIKRVRVNNSRAKAVIAGQGTLSQWLAKEIRKLGLEKTVFLLGRRDDVARIMAACQVVLLTSEYEGTPNVLIEAQWLGVPVVATRAGGSAETVAHKVGGFLHEVGDVEALAQSVSRLLNDPETGRRMGLSGRRFVEKTFDLQGSVSATLDLYRDCFKAPGP